MASGMTSGRQGRLRRFAAPWKEITRAGLGLVLGLLLVVGGALLSFNAPLRTLLVMASRSGYRLVSSLMPRAQADLAVHWTGAALLVLGLYVMFRSGRSGAVQVLETLNPSLKRGRVDVYMRRRRLAQGPRIVAIGGGTGLSTLLRGLKVHTSNITAIVTVTDDGGSSGRLISDLGMIPPGDIRNCLVALAEAEKAMTDLFQHRFAGDTGSLAGHSMGNLLIGALVEQAHGDFERAVEIASSVLAIRGQVMPATLSHVGLTAEFDDGSERSGETAIAGEGKGIKRIRLSSPDVKAYAPALEAIAGADLVCLGPGSVYTSVIPPLLVPGVAEALMATEAKVVYVCNVMTQPGESDAMTADDHVAAILAHVDARALDAVMVNTGVPSEAAVARYREMGQILVEPDTDRIRRRGLQVLPGDAMSETDVVRHDPAKVAARLLRLVGA